MESQYQTAGETPSEARSLREKYSTSSLGGGPPSHGGAASLRASQDSLLRGSQELYRGFGAGGSQGRVRCWRGRMRCGGCRKCSP